MNGTPEMYNNSEQTVTILEWCAGYSGIGMGIRRVIKDLRTIGYSEIEEYPITVLAALMEKGLIDVAPIWTNLKSFPYESFRGKVDILVAGFPCQPFSHAGKRGGDEDPRHLWPYISRAIGIIRPRYVFCENVEGILSARLAGPGWSDPEGTPVLMHVLRELERLGYRSTAGLFSAAERGAPHNRKRTFICGMDDSQMHRCKCGIFNPDNIGSTDIPIAGTDIPWPTGPSEAQQLWEPPRAIFISKRGAATDDDGDDEDGVADPDSGGLEGSDEGGGEGGCTDAMCESGEQPDTMENTTGTGGGSEGGDTLHKGRRASKARRKSLPKDTGRKVRSSIPDNQPASGDGGTVQLGKESTDVVNPTDGGRDTTEQQGGVTLGRPSETDRSDCDGSTRGQLGDPQHDGCTPVTELRGDEATSLERTTEEQDKARQPKGANGSDDVSSLSGSECGSQRGCGEVGTDKEAQGTVGDSQVMFSDGSFNYPRICKRPCKVSQSGDTGGQGIVADNDGQRSQELGAIPVEKEHSSIGNNDRELGNPTGERLCRGGKDCSRVQSEMPRQGFESVGGDMAYPGCHDAGCACEPERASGDLTGQGEAGDLGDTASPGQQARERGPGEGEIGGADCGSCPHLRDCQALKQMGGDTNGSTIGVGSYRLPGLSDYELAEICEWLQKTPHRAEELKMLGNGVVPAVSELAWRTLVKRLWEGKVSA